jgi:hypothetical protein
LSKPPPSKQRLVINQLSCYPDLDV